jgi:hypothetical protein
MHLVSGLPMHPTQYLNLTDEGLMLLEAVEDDSRPTPSASRHARLGAQEVEVLRHRADRSDG